MNLKNTVPYIKLIGSATLIAAAVAAIWYFFCWHYFQQHAEDTQTTGAAVAGFLVFSAIIPAIILAKVSYDAGDVKNAIETFEDLKKANGTISAEKKKEALDKAFRAFEKACNNKVHPLIHITIIMVSLCAIISVCMIPFQSFEHGFFFVFALAMIHSFLYIAVIEIDNPLNGFLVSENIPSEWIKRMKENKAAVEN